ncbi:hypothetical protein [Pleurocapsa sp. PCC 7319]|uniref:hypothetical protein n=1 Tax=Pleurocapsa sp. PCC 7319 TaxID=118161 RepID=UPI000345011D|nr:hypothetical protein [Pleurocapsa sp. PCC 7319]
MIQGRIPELTIKFTERPQNLPEEGKKVVIEVKGENKITVKAEVNRKSLKKIVGKMDTWDNWVASLSGKVKSISPDGVVELVEAGVNIFEIKKKEPKAKSDSTAA